MFGKKGWKTRVFRKTSRPHVASRSAAAPSCHRLCAGLPTPHRTGRGRPSVAAVARSGDTCHNAHCQPNSRLKSVKRDSRENQAFSSLLFASFSVPKLKSWDFESRRRLDDRRVFACEGLSLVIGHSSGIGSREWRVIDLCPFIVYRLPPTICCALSITPYTALSRNSRKPQFEGVTNDCCRNELCLLMNFYSKPHILYILTVYRSNYQAVFLASVT